MKEADEYIDKILLNKANLEYIAEHLRINGTLYTSLKELFKQAQKESYNQAIDDAAERAGRFVEFYVEDKVTESAIKQSILKLKK